MVQPRINRNQIQNIESTKVIFVDFDVEQSYLKDTIVKYDGQLYIALEDIEAGEWNIEQWNPVGAEYIAGTGIDITDNVISTSNVPSDDVEYTYSGQSFETVKDVLDMLMAEKFWVNPSASISVYYVNDKGQDVQVPTGTFEKGYQTQIDKVKWSIDNKGKGIDTTKDNLAMSGAYSKNIMADTSITDKSKGTIVLDTPIIINENTTSKTITVTFTDNHTSGKPAGSQYTNVAKATTGAPSFGTIKYWGISAKDTLTDSDIRGLAHNDWYSSVKLPETSFDCTPTESHPDGFYIYYAVPSKVDTDPEFNLNGLPNTAYEKTIKTDYKNVYGKTITYTIYRFMKDNKLTTKYKLQVV